MITIGEGVFVGIVCFIFGVLFGYSIGSWNRFEFVKGSENE